MLYPSLAPIIVTFTTAGGVGIGAATGFAIGTVIDYRRSRSSSISFRIAIPAGP